MALIYDNQSKSKVDNRLLMLSLKGETDEKYLRNSFYLGAFTMCSTYFSENHRLNYNVMDNYESLISSGRARAIDYDIKYRQVKKAFGHYLSIGRSIYLHLFGVGNRKRKVEVYEKTFSISNYNVIWRENETDSIALTTNADNNTGNIYYGYRVGISKRSNITPTIKREEHYRKSNSPLLLPDNCKNGKIEDNDKYFTISLYFNINLWAYASPIKPMYIPMTNIKDMLHHRGGILC